MTDVPEGTPSQEKDAPVLPEVTPVDRSHREKERYSADMLPEELPPTHRSLQNISRINRSIG